ncbi:zinc carboxypeptidase [Zhouia spongiae]|uniref:Zinc carboxypeptidase n=1 Tax=Zhouia spongiae TaxID=2202721 RepID=A0ABY3YML4_9FLAO|nr:M14 metallopeptidase family protein [Zhouia spongiae]UNY98860.1 zinc carboxypeptidase [Zhouia spongiae]
MKPTLLIIAFLSALIATSQPVKSPSGFLGYELGSYFSRHHQVIDYYKHLARTYPEKIRLEEYGKTYEGRELLLVFISSEENINNLENIRKTHLNTAKGNDPGNKVIVWLSYNVHGNEAVSTEASMRTSYELLTGKQEWLENTIVIIDPCVNPDGRDRYVNWYNQFKNSPYNADPNSKEHHEEWLSGRPNHYMFDLNRDWAWITQKESQQRLKMYNKWLPHVHVDFHEQGVDAPYYFAPAAEPLHEVITDWQKEFQATIGKNHAKYFDEKGWLYFTKEIFDLLYPSYGDTYPTYNGAIGMTYEQGGSGRAGLGIINSNGDTLTLKDRIAHHNTTGLSTIEISSLNEKRLNEEFKKFYHKQDFKYKSYVLSGDPGKIQLLTDLLDAHEIVYGYADRPSTVKGYDFSEGKNGSVKTTKNDLVISTNQLKGTLVKVLFEPKTKLSDSLTYDITAWSLPYAYGLNAIASENHIPATEKNENFSSSIHFSADNYAYVGNWKSMNDARFLATLINYKVRVRYTTEPFEVRGQLFDRGSLIITTADNKHNPAFLSQLKEASDKHKKELVVAETGFVDSGKDFGSNAVKMIPKVKIGILSGPPFSTLSFGEVWHYFEQQLKYPVSVLGLSYFNQINLSEYDVLILPETRDQINDNVVKLIKKWVENGGKLISIGSSVNNLADDSDFGISHKKEDNDNEVDEGNSVDLTPFSGHERDYMKKMITGAIFKAKVDKTHPMSFGYDDHYFTLKLNSSAYEFLKGGNAVYINEKHSPYNGFAGSDAIAKQKNTVVLGSNPLGKGQIVIMVDNPLFRGFWENGKLFIANSVFFLGN